MNMKRFITCVLIVSTIFFIFPIMVYGLFMRFFQLVPPTGFGAMDLLILIPSTLLGGFVFVLIFFLAQGSKLGQNGLLYGLLWLLGFSVVCEVGFWVVFQYSPIMMAAGVASGVCYFINGVIFERLGKPTAK